MRSADGSSIVSFTEGSSDYQRLRVEAPPGSVFGVMGDGSPFVISSQPKLAKVYRGRTATDLALPADALVLAASSGPDDSLWLADAVRGNIRIVTASGLLRDLVYPELPPGQPIMKLKVLPDGSFLAATNQSPGKFDRLGRLLWSWDGKADGLAIAFSTFTDFVTAPGGILYVSDWTGKRIFRLAEPGAILSPDLARVATSTRAIAASSAAAAASAAAAGSAAARLALADAYEAMGATEAARAALARYLEEKPADARAADRELSLGSALLKTSAAAASDDAKSLLSRFGPETARAAYSRAMRSLESLRSHLPYDRDVQTRISSLRKLFRDAEGAFDAGGASAAPAPLVLRTELAALFPSMLQAYRSKPAGAVFVKNILPEPLRDLRVDLFIPKYMDFPSPGPVLQRLEAGAEARLDLNAFLSDKVLDIEEDLPLQALVTLRFTDSRGQRTVEYTRPVTLYRRTALTWVETGRLASFVTPNEETIGRAAFSMLQGLDAEALLSPAFQRAAAICDSLGSLPLRYVPDPQSAFQTASGDATVVDTVRFPRTTLAYRAGDCDDSTALLCSLLEAAGLPTAILTSPGHVFLAFDSGEKLESAWLFASPGYETIAEGEKLWIPIESTALSGGFAKSWKSASELVQRWRGGKDFEFLPLQRLRATYPALPLPPSTLPIALPDRESRDALLALSTADLGKGLYAPAMARLETSRKTATGKDWNRESNRLAQLHARFGRSDLATLTLKEILKKDPQYVAAWLNLAAMSILAEQRDEALGLLRQAAAAIPGSTVLGDFALTAGLADALAASGVKLASSGGASGGAAATAPSPSGGSGGQATAVAGASSPATDSTRASGGKELIWIEP